jgi:hypothetical protein
MSTLLLGQRLRTELCIIRLTYSNGFCPEWWTDGMIMIWWSRKFPGLLPGIIHSAPILVAAPKWLGCAAVGWLRLRVGIPQGVCMCIVCEWRVFSVKSSLRRANHLPEGFLPSMMCLNVIVKLRQWGDLSRLGALGAWKNNSFMHSIIHSVFRLTAGPWPLPKRVLHRGISIASCFNFQYLLASFRSSSSCLRLLPLLPFPFYPSLYLSFNNVF